MGIGGSEARPNIKSSSLEGIGYAPMVRSSYERLKAQEVQANKGSKTSGWKEAYLSLTEEDGMYLLDLHNPPRNYNSEANFPAAFTYEDYQDISNYLEQVGVPSDIPFY